MRLLALFLLLACAQSAFAASKGTIGVEVTKEGALAGFACVMPTSSTGPGPKCSFEYQRMNLDKAWRSVPALHRGSPVSHPDLTVISSSVPVTLEPGTYLARAKVIPTPNKDGSASGPEFYTNVVPVVITDDRKVDSKSQIVDWWQQMQGPDVSPLPSPAPIPSPESNTPH